MLNAEQLQEMAKDCNTERIRTRVSAAHCAECLLGSICKDIEKEKGILNFKKMNLRERIKEMIKRGQEAHGQGYLSKSYWNGYVAFGQELKFHVKPKDKE